MEIKIYCIFGIWAAASGDLLDLFTLLCFLINERYLYTKEIKDCLTVVKIFPKQILSLSIQLSAFHDDIEPWEPNNHN